MNMISSNNVSSKTKSLLKKVFNKKFAIVVLVILLIGGLGVGGWYAYTNWQKPNANTLQSSLQDASKKLEDYKKANNDYPDALDCSSKATDKTICVKSPNGTEFVYQPDNENDPKTFTLYIKNDVTSYRVYAGKEPAQVAMVCPVGFINVPGSKIYGTENFCVMKYEAKAKPSNYGTGSSGLPIRGISQQGSVEASKKVCEGCQLITEAQWLTIARDVLSVPANWSGNAVGSGYIAMGHSDGEPDSALAADIDDSNGLSGTNSTDNQQKRTLTLSNGEVIWDFAGNLYEWTQGIATGGQPGGKLSGYKLVEWPDATVKGTLEPSPFPATTGLAGADTWTSENGIGMLYSNPKETQSKAIARGGSWNDNKGGRKISGVLTMLMPLAPDQQVANAGFRVTK